MAAVTDVGYAVVSLEAWPVEPNTLRTDDEPGTLEVGSGPRFLDLAEGMGSMTKVRSPHRAQSSDLLVGVGHGGRVQALGRAVDLEAGGPQARPPLTLMAGPADSPICTSRVGLGMANLSGVSARINISVVVPRDSRR